MNNLHLLIRCIIVVLFLTSCKKEPSDLPPTNISTDLKSEQIIEADNQFGLELFNQIIQEEASTQNLMISPLSVSLALGMAYNGAEGETKAQIEEMMHKTGLTPEEINETYKSLVGALEVHDPKVELSISNAIFYNEAYSFKQEFMNTNKSFYNAEIDALDFSNSASTLETVNNWVNAQTKGKIEKILDQVSPFDVMYLINAIYFNGEWTYQFNKQDTEIRAFYLEDNSEIEVPTMKVKETFNYTFEDEFELLELPYGGEKYSMVIFLPHDGYTIKDIAALLSPENIDSWLNKTYEAEKTVYLPKFEFAYRNSLPDNMKALGMIDAFSDTDADFSGISDTYLYITEVLHKSYIKVDEKGTEAAAVTGITVGITSVGPDPVFAVDHPFVFAIRETDTNAILFIGKVTDPLDNGE